MTARCPFRNGHIQCERPTGHRNLHQAEYVDERGRRRLMNWAAGKAAA